MFMINRLKVVFLLGALVCINGSVSVVLGYEVSLKKEQGKSFKPVNVKKVQVQTKVSYTPAPGDEPVGTLVLTFDPGEIGLDAQLLRKTAAEEAAAIGANAIYQLSVTFDKKTDAIAQATYQCIRTRAAKKRP